MTIPGWERMYAGIIKEFGYDRDRDEESAAVLGTVIRESDAEARISGMIRDRAVFVAGSGPSLPSAIKHIKRCRGRAVVVAADSSAGLLVRNKIVPDVIITDLDGDLGLFDEMADTQTIFVVHAHGDNRDRLHMAGRFKNCIGTAQSGQSGRIHNFGGFTDGDRAVFLASHYGADRIILFGMDFGDRIGRHSGTKMQDRQTKIAKLRKGKEILEWLATHTESKLFTTSRPIRGFDRIPYGSLDSVAG